MQRFAVHLVTAVDFPHEHNFIHTDIKPHNIFVKFRLRSRIEPYLAEVPVPQQDSAQERYTPVKSTPFRRYYFSEADHTRVAEFQVALGDWGVSSSATQHLTERIQPVALRASEVLIEAPWDKSVEWWNLGALLLEFYRAVRMFDGRVPPDGRYDVKEHVAEIVSLFGPLPKDLLDPGNQHLVRSIFDDQGRPKDCPPMDGPSLASEDVLPGEARDLFASFLSFVMKINPAERPSAEQMLTHPWIGMVLKPKTNG
ncbi:putative srpk [Parathielavia hyrcaniae]|uniref:Srpk n=1 Tax=Parathielavia hyrcaniae TaxID=113614 RepID=A0AAN6PXB8_9PEZI|nr:putative srpk [Parathielavia hyrcaniae]